MIQNNLKKRILTSLFLVMIILLIFLLKFSLIFFLICFGILSIVEFSSITKKIFKKRTTYFTSNFFFIIYIFFFTLLFFHLSNFLETKTYYFNFNYLHSFRCWRLYFWQINQRSQINKD